MSTEDAEVLRRCLRGDEKAYREMYRVSGQTLAPVIEVDGKVLADFGARELAAFWKAVEADGA